MGDGGQVPGAGREIRLQTSNAVKSFRDLRVWQAGIELVEQVYRLSRGFPREEIYGLTSQTQRSAVSVPANLAEGHTREHGREYLHHISIAQASLAELETHLEIAKRLGYISQDQLDDVLVKVRSLGKQLYALRNAVAKSFGPAPDTWHLLRSHRNVGR
jgi:four helix bundle protein